MDGRRRTTPIILKTLDVDRFDHSASWPAKVRNVSRLGSQHSRTPTFSAVFIDSSTFPSRPYPKHSAGLGSSGLSVSRNASFGEQPEPQGSVSKATDFPSNSPFSPVDRVQLLTAIGALEAKLAVSNSDDPPVTVR